MRPKGFLLAVLIATGAATLAAGQRPIPAAPKLVVLLMVDQMRADFVDRFQDDWSSGLKRLVAEGAWFSNVAYPYLTTVTCAGHATVATGTFPHIHGVFQNAWYDRPQRRQIACTDDAAVSPVRYDGQGGRIGHSSARLLAPTFADALREQRQGRVVSLSLKARSAIMMAGRGGDAVTWRSDALDAWETSTMFASAPVPAVKAFVDSNPMAADYGRTWSLLLPESRYRQRDDGEGEAPPKGWTSRFPHILTGDEDDKRPDEEFYTQWERSPFADAYLGRFATSLAEAFALGTTDGTDFLAISFSTPDLVGHAFGPDSREVQDLYAHLDRTVGLLLDKLDALAGRGRYVVVLSADHGVTALPEQLVKAGHQAGRVNSARLADAVERIAAAAAGPGRYITRISGNDVYFEPGMYNRLEARPAALEAVVKALAAEAPVARVFTSEDLRAGAASTDPLLRAAALSYVPSRGGDLVFALKPGYMPSTTGTTHGSANPDDQRVPLILMGPGIKPGQYREPATPADVAPTLAALVGVTMTRAEGHVLRAALATP